MLNNVCLQGRITKDPELKETKNGKSVTSFSLAVDRSYAKPGEERQSDFIFCKAFGKTADFICKYFFKGDMMICSGELHTSYDKEKEKGYHEVLLNAVNFGGTKKKDEENNEYKEPDYVKANYQASKKMTTDEDFVFEDEDLPF